MVTVRITGGELHDNVTATLPEVDQVMETKGKKPGEILETMVELGWYWEIDFSENTDDEEYQEWVLAELVACIHRAVKLGKTIFIGGELVNTDFAEATKALENLILECGDAPINDENSMTLIISAPPDEDEPEQ